MASMRRCHLYSGKSRSGCKSNISSLSFRIRLTLWISMRLSSLPRSDQAALSFELCLCGSRVFLITEKARRPRRRHNRSPNSIYSPKQRVVKIHQTPLSYDDRPSDRRSRPFMAQQIFHAFPRSTSAPLPPHGEAINLHAPRLISRTDHIPIPLIESES